jgi:hypothetical protein
MREISTLSSLEGRSILRDIFRELRFERQMGTAKIIELTWRICTRERDLQKYGKEPIRVLHVLGTISGTSLWLEEIVNRFFFSTINSFVYVGAAVLLVTIGLRRIYDVVPDWIVISSICLEAFLLSIMFFIMYFSPIDECFCCRSIRTNY